MRQMFHRTKLLARITLVFSSFLMLLAYPMPLKAHSFDFRLAYQHDIPDRKIQGMQHINGIGLQASWYPMEAVPVAFLYQAKLGSIGSYTERTRNQRNFWQSDTTLQLSNNLFGHLFGLMLANQDARQLINPYVSASAGWGIISTRIRLTETDRRFEEEQTRSLANARLMRSARGIYHLESGVEIFPGIRKRELREDQSRALVGIQISGGFTGSFGNMTYLHLQDELAPLIPTGKEIEDSYNYLKNELAKSPVLYSHPLRLWQLSAGVVVRF